MHLVEVALQVVLFCCAVHSIRSTHESAPWKLLALNAPSTSRATQLVQWASCNVATGFAKGLVSRCLGLGRVCETLYQVFYSCATSEAVVKCFSAIPEALAIWDVMMLEFRADMFHPGPYATAVSLRAARFQPLFRVCASIPMVSAM